MGPGADQELSNCRMAGESGGGGEKARQPATIRGKSSDVVLQSAQNGVGFGAYIQTADYVGRVGVIIS